LDQSESPAYAALPRSARRAFSATAIGDGSSAEVSYTDFMLEHHISRWSISPSLKLLDHLGRIKACRFDRRALTISQCSPASSL
jgi:hypothetical protein